MLQRGESVPHFDVRTLEGEPFSYSTIWQRRNLVLVTLPALDSESIRSYVTELRARAQEFSGQNAECVVTRDRVPGMTDCGALVADRWGEIVYSAARSDVPELPRIQELLEWVEYVQTRCPECEGEAK